VIETAIQRAYVAVRDRGVRVEPSRWQSMDVSKRAEATTYEVLNHTVQFQVLTESLPELRDAILPNLPWADDHFQERVGGSPLNPGVEWSHWPWANSANSFRHEPIFGQKEQGFSHTYMERMWPKHAHAEARASEGQSRMRGIRYEYGDAGDVVRHLAQHPDSRQAYLPIWFPEDTGKTDVRVPCTLGYHLIHRHGFLHCTYYIRSCDLYRHLRDDVYLTVRLQLWVLDQLRQPGQHSPLDWRDVRPGLFTMHVVSLHCFVNDMVRLWPEWRPR